MSQSYEIISQWISSNPIFGKIVIYAFWLLTIFLLMAFLKRYVKRSLPDNTLRYKSQKGVELIGYIFILLLTVFYFSGNIKDFTLAVGLLTAGITITLQELILSLAGSFYIFLVKVYKPGDRIEINGIKGDVMDIDSIYTTMMEIGQWVTSDNYNGRIVKLSNSFVFKGPVYNYSQDFPFLWDEIDLPIRFGSDIELAKKLVLDTAKEVLLEYVTGSVQTWKSVVGKYYIEDAMVEPTVAVSITDNWIRLNLRYIVDFKKRRITRHILSERILLAFTNSQGKIELGSTTIEVVRMPEK